KWLLITGYIYLEMLQNYFIPELRRLKITRSTVSQQGGAPYHSPRSVRQFLNEVLPNRCTAK
ncbi:hypothetical protein Cfor_03687, partial [Coptotermes formosanus]